MNNTKVTVHGIIDRIPVTAIDTYGNKVAGVSLKNKDFSIDGNFKHWGEESVAPIPDCSGFSCDMYFEGKDYVYYNEEIHAKDNVKYITDNLLDLFDLQIDNNDGEYQYRAIQLDAIASFGTLDFVAKVHRFPKDVALKLDELNNLDKYKQSIIALEQEIEQLRLKETELNQVKPVLENLQSIMTVLLEKANAYKNFENFAQIEITKDNLADYLTALIAQNTSNKTNLENKTQELIQSQSNLQNKIQELSTANSNLQQRTQELENANNQIQVLNNQIQTLEEQITTLRENIANLTQTISDRDTQILNKQRELDNVKIQLQNKIQELTQAQEQIRVKTEELAQSQNSNQTLQERIDELRADINRIENEKSDLSTLQQRIQSELDSIKQEKLRVEESLTEKTQLLTNAEETIRTLRGEIDNLNQLLQEERGKVSNLEQQKQTIGNERNNLIQENQGLIREKQELTQNLDLEKNNLIQANLEKANLLNELNAIKKELTKLGIQNLNTTNDIINFIKSDLSLILEQSKLYKAVEEKIRELKLPVNKTPIQLLEYLKNRSDILANIEKIIEDKLWINKNQDIETNLLNVLNEIEEILKLANVSNLSELSQELKRLQEIEIKYKELEKILGNDVKTRISNLISKEEKYNQIKDKFNGIDENKILEQIDNLNLSIRELEKINTKLEELGISSINEISDAIKRITSEKTRLENLLKKLTNQSDLSKLTEEEVNKLIINQNPKIVEREVEKFVYVDKNAGKLSLLNNQVYDLKKRYNSLEINHKEVLSENEKLKLELLKYKQKYEGHLSNFNNSENLISNLNSLNGFSSNASLSSAPKISQILETQDNWDLQFNRNEFAKALFDLGNLQNRTKPDNFKSLDSPFKDNKNEYVDYLRKQYITIGIGNEKFGGEKELDFNMLGAFALRYNNIYNFDYKEAGNIAYNKGLLTRKNYKNKLEVTEDLIKWNKKD